MARHLSGTCFHVVSSLFSVVSGGAGTVKEILGTCQSVGCTVEGHHPHDKIDEVNDGTIAIPVSVHVCMVLV